MFDKFTDRSRKVLGMARQEARRMNHQWIGTEHLLLGIVLENGGVAADVLRRMAVDLDDIRAEVEKIVQDGPSMVTMGSIPLTPRAKKALELAREEADELRHNYIGTEHLILGLIREGDGVAAQVLLNLGVTLEELRRNVRGAVGADPGPEAPAAPTATPTSTGSTTSTTSLRITTPGTPAENPCPYCGEEQSRPIDVESGQSIQRCNPRSRVAGHYGCGKLYVLCIKKVVTRKLIGFVEQPE